MSGENGQALATRNGNSAALVFDDEKIALIKRTILRPKKRDATDDELALFIHQCERTGLDPLNRQIYGIYRWNSQIGQEVMTVQTGIDGFRLIAKRSASYLGQTPTYWCDSELRWFEVWPHSEPPFAAKVGVYVKGAPEPTWAIARYSSFHNSNNPLWRSMPDHMLGKCAEALALRKAFPAELSGLYIPEEMEQADAVEQVEINQEPVQDGDDAEEVDGEIVRDLDPEKVDYIAEGFKRLRMTYKQINLMLGSCGIDALRAYSRKALIERLKGLSDEQAQALIAELDRAAEQPAEAES